MPRCLKCECRITKDQHTGVFDIKGVKVGPYCDNCWSSIRMCMVCDKPHSLGENISYYSSVEAYVCEECVKTSMKMCGGCGEVTIVTSEDGVELCKSCRSQVFKCGSCGGLHLKELRWARSYDSHADELVMLEYTGIYHKYGNDRLCLSCFHSIKYRFKRTPVHQCARCSRLFNKTSAPNDKWCSQCYDNYTFQCDDCGTVGMKNTNEMHGHIVEEDGEVRRKVRIGTCCKHKYFYCMHCKVLYSRSSVHFHETFDGRYECENCVDMPMCEWCGRRHPESFMSTKNKKYCKNCIEQFMSCQVCNEHTPETKMVETVGKFMCRACAADHSHGHEWGYYHKPYLMPKGKHSELMMGFENEISFKPTFQRFERVGAILKHYPEDLLCCKWDRSVYNGSEVVTHPMTMEYFKTIDWSHLFPEGTMTAHEVLIGNYKHQETGDPVAHTGFHVHLSKKHFKSFHLYKFINFMYQNHKFVEMIGERSSNDFCPNFPHYGEVKSAAKLKETSSRTFIYMPEGSKTVELRFFAGCHTVEMLHKNMEFAQSSYDYTRYVSPKDAVDVEKYVLYVLKNDKKFPNLAAFLTKQVKEV